MMCLPVIICTFLYTLLLSVTVFYILGYNAHRLCLVWRYLTFYEMYRIYGLFGYLIDRIAT